MSGNGQQEKCYLNREKRKLNVIVIGAGLAGLCAAKHAKLSGHSVTIYEQRDEIGGQWFYTDATGLDENGLNVPSAMYQNLRTNLPKEIMGFHDYPIPASPVSYITSDEFFAYLKSFVDHFELQPLINFKFRVIHVIPTKDMKWRVTVHNLLTKEIKIAVYDAIFVCNGHYSVPFTPPFEGFNEFQGHTLHSHDYRKAVAFKDKIVVIIGAGPSGVDLTYAIAPHAKAVIFSHRQHNYGHSYPDNVIRRGLIKRFTRNSVIFHDKDEKFTITDVIFCTGYEYSMPFLDKDCQLRIDDNYIAPLYKHCINAEYPTMAVIGVVFTSAITQMIDLQVKFVMQYLNGFEVLPSRELRINDSTHELMKRLALGWPKKKGHSTALHFQRDYFNDLVATAHIQMIPEVFFKIYEDSSVRRSADPVTYRDDVYTIVDDENFTRIRISDRN